MIRLSLATVVRSQRIVGPIFGIFLVTLVVVAQGGGQRPGAVLAGTALLALPVHAWLGYACGGAYDEATVEVLRVAAGPRRLYGSEICAATALGVAAEAIVLGAALGLRVMGRAPSGAQWVTWGIAASCALGVGGAAGLAARWIASSRGAQLVGLLALVTAAGLLLPFARITRVLDPEASAPPTAVSGRLLAAAAVCIAATAVVLAAAGWAGERRRH